MYHQRRHSIMLRRADIIQELAYPKPYRDQLIHLLAANMGFRTGEIATARIENVNLPTRTIYVTDSKQDREYPIPIDDDSARLMDFIIGNCSEGWLIQRHHMAHHGSRQGKPLTDTQIWTIVRRYAIKSGIASWKQFNPRLLRHYFAVTFAKGKNGKPGNLEILRTILRHKSLAYTQIYLSRLIFWEDIQGEFNRVHPTKRRHENVNTLVNDTLANASISKLYQEQCVFCEHQSVCRHIDQAIENQWADGCRFYKPKEVQPQP